VGHVAGCAIQEPYSLATVQAWDLGTVLCCSGWQGVGGSPGREQLLLKLNSHLLYGKGCQ
jgi:hypothetical protein